MNWDIAIPLLIAVAAWVPQVWQWIGTKRARDAGLVSDYIKIADMTGEQLEKKINQINVLEKQVESLQAQITAMQIDHNNKQIENNKVMQAMKDYIGVLIAILREHKIEIPQRPDILKESNPKIQAIK
jgi:TolA-binding protein